MSVTVLIQNRSGREGDGHHTFENGHNWHIDESGFLHVRHASGKHIASFHPRHWKAATAVEPSMSDLQKEVHATRRVEAKARAEAEAKFRAQRGDL